jgi:serine/threonine protein kinase
MSIAGTTQAIDEHTARLIEQILSSQVGGWQAKEYLERGASALVFAAEREGRSVALKVFDPHFLKEHGEEKQAERIERQVELRDASHPNLVQILDGGRCPRSGLHFIVMPLLQGRTLDKVVAELPRDRIRPILAQIAVAAKFLEENNLVHRDIKPANIIVVGDNYDQAILLDLGVVRKFGLSDLTDTSKTKNFVGTTRYSPPEFNIRYEQSESPEAWRAITFYQLGAVLHDLIMRRPLFHDYSTPYQRLVYAVLLVDPCLDCNEVPTDLVRLARSCLQKDPAKRLQLVTWDMFNEAAGTATDLRELKERILHLRQGAQASQPARAATTACEGFVRALSTDVRQACVSDRETFPPVHIVFDNPNHPQSFAASYATSQRHLLRERLHVLFYPILVDEVSPIFELRYTAVLGRAVPPLDQETLEPHLISLGHYRGASEATENAIYLVHSAIARATEELLLNQSLPAGTDPYWASISTLRSLGYQYVKVTCGVKQG